MEVTSASTPSSVVPSVEPKLSFSLSKAWGYLGKLFLSMLLGSLVLLLLLTISDHSLSTDSPVMKLLFYVVPFFLFAIYLKVKGMLGLVLQPEAGAKQVPIVLYLLILLFVPAVQIALEPAMSLIPMPEAVREIFENQFGGNNVFTFLTIVVAAPVLEEFVLRGLLLRGLLKNYTPGKAIVWTSVMFAVLHLNPWQGIGAFILGLVLGWIYYKTRSIWPCIFLHLANNLLGFLMILALPEGAATTSLYDMVGSPALFALLYVAALLVLMLSLLQIRRVLYKV